MKTIKIAILTIALAFSAASVFSQTTFKIDTVIIDSGSVVTYCLGKQMTYVSVQMKLSGYSNGDSVKMIASFGDGTKDSARFVIYAGPSYSYCYGGFSHMYASPGYYYVQVYAEAPDLKTDTKISGNVAFVYLCGNVSGQLYVDQNNNCTKNVNEPPLTWSFLEITNNTNKSIVFAYTDANGYYNIDLPVSFTYSIKIGSPPYKSVCPINGYSNVSSPSSGNDFGIQCGSAFDLTGEVWGINFRPGFNRGFSARPFNNSCFPVNGKMKVVISDPLISYVSQYYYSWYQNPTIKGDTLIWNFSNISYASLYSWNSNTYFHFYLFTSASAQIGDTICLDMIIEPLTGDADPTDNVKQFCFPVNNSYDPNNKIGLPLGEGPDKVIDPGRSISYTINFQNMGNDTAYKVVVIDSLPDELDPGTIEIHGATHPFEFYMVENHVLKFEFKGINLPDDKTNDILSQGAVNFTISPKEGLPLGTLIENNSYIYFDFNEAVQTNTEHHKIDILNGITDIVPVPDVFVQMYPNPAKSLLWLDVRSDESARVRIYDLIGKEVAAQKLSRGITPVSLTGLPNGVYLVNVSAGSENKTLKLIIQR